MKSFNLVLTIAAAGLLPAATPEAMAAGEPLPKSLEFEITRGVNPAQQGIYGGRVKFERADTKSVFKVTWTLADGVTTTGWGVPYPKSGAMAVAYGKNAAGVAIYKKDGDKFDARWAAAREGSPMGEYTVQRGKEKGRYVLAGGATGGMTVTPSPETAGLAMIEYQLPAGKFAGFGVAAGDYMAAVSYSGGTDAGVVVYQMTPDLNANGKWYLSGAKGLGSEDLKLLSIDGEALPAQSGASGGGLEAEVTALAGKLRGKKDELLKLKPTKEQIARIAASSEDASLLAAYTDKIYAGIPAAGLDGSAEQTEIRAFGSDSLPGGYAKHGDRFKKDVAVYGFKFVKPGESAGMSFDGLVKLDGQWVMIPKMWRAFEK